MAKVLKLSKSVEEGTQELLKFLLEKGKIKAVFSLRKFGANGVAYSLITRPDMLKEVVPFFPLMPANGGKLLSRLTVKEPVVDPIAVIVRPCELRAFIELVKREQGSLDNFLFISYTCPGVYPLEMQVNGDLYQKVPKYWDTVREGNIVLDIRDTCKGCNHLLPYSADITIALIGKNFDRECELFINSDKGKEFIEGMEGEVVEDKIETQELNGLQAKRVEERKKLFNQINTENLGLSQLTNTFIKCIGCRGCRRVCPICYCNLCTFDSRDYEYEPFTYENEMSKRGAIRVPPNTLLYQIGRLLHVGISCVGCGMCTDICPADIPLSTIFLKVSEEVQQMFNYIPGKDVKEALPFTTYESVEFTEMED